MLVLLGVLAGGSALGGLPMAQGAPTPAAGLTLTVEGLSPAAIGLGWSEATDLGFNGYGLFEGTSASGPWTHVATLSIASETSYFVSGLSPNSTLWWKVVEYELLGGSVASNTVRATQPAVALLQLTPGNGGAVDLSWTNGASYGGSVAFGSYTVEQSAQGGPYQAIQVLTGVGETSATVRNLTPATSYSFLVRTSDACSAAPDCSATPASVTGSNDVPWSTPGALTVTVSASTHVVEAGLPVQLSCAAVGGVRPYQYSWAFADGTTGHGANVTHAYPLPGDYTILCAVQDAGSTQASNSTTVSVLPNGASSNGTNGSKGGGGNGGGSGSNGSGPTSGSGGNGGRPGGSSGGGSIGEQPPVPAGVGPIAAAVILIGFIGAVIWLATLVNRRRPRPVSAPEEPEGPPPDWAPITVPPGARLGAPDPGEIPPVPAPDPPAPAPPTPETDDLDGLLDRMEDLSPP